MPNHPIQDFFSRRFRSLLSASPDGTPPWFDEIAGGHGRGLFLPNEAPWVVHADLATLVGGIRALLMQALHPGSLAGVRSHSRYRDDPLGRLAGTIRWLTTTTFASHEALAREASRVNRMHAHVRGEYQDARGGRCPYHATDRPLLLWVHIAFMDSFLRAHQQYSATPIPGGADAYIRLWSKSVEPLGLRDVPMNETELLECIDVFQADLVVSQDTRDVVRWIQHPPLPRTSLPVYRLLFQAAIASMPDTFQRMLDLPSLPPAVVRPLARGLLRAIRLAIGPDSPLEDAALARLTRDGIWPGACG